MVSGTLSWLVLIALLGIIRPYNFFHIGAFFLISLSAQGIVSLVIDLIEYNSLNSWAFVAVPVFSLILFGGLAFFSPNQPARITVCSLGTWLGLDVGGLLALGTWPSFANYHQFLAGYLALASIFTFLAFFIWKLSVIRFFGSKSGLV
jgi:hypothetical protein